MNEGVEVFVPGRLCILGEHSDWAAAYRKNDISIEKGYAIVVGLNLGVYLRGWKNDVFSYEFNENKIELTLDELNQFRKSDFFEYVVASAKVMLQRYSVGGARIICEKMTLPIKKGLASSAAICLAVIRLYNYLYNLDISIEEEMVLAYLAEKSIGSNCGKMDHICAYGPGVRKVVFDGNDFEISQIMPEKDLFFVLVDLKGTKNTKKILADLNNEFVKGSNEGKLVSFLGETNKAYVDGAANAISLGYLNLLSNILVEYQKMFDENVSCYSSELKAPKLHEIMTYSLKETGILACKGVGSQGDGMAQLLIETEEDCDRIASKIQEKYGYDCYKVVVYHNDLNVIIPIAGRGTRMYPFARMVDKAFVPIIFENRVYPAIILIILEVLSSKGVNKIDLIINNRQQMLIGQLMETLKIEQIKAEIENDLQRKKGFGGAISSSRYVEQKGFSLVCLGDYVYKSKNIGDCTKQLVEFWRKNGKSVVGIKPISVMNSESYGVVYGRWVDDVTLIIEKVIEKPSPSYAEKELLIESNGEKKLFAFFGQYIVNNSILKSISLSKENGEIGFSEYLNEYAENNVLYGYVVEGESFDLGNPEDYYNSFVEYGKIEVYDKEKRFM